ncbi:MAG: ribonucleoside-diphosphate reductase large chain [Amphiamblys sp. WSBS2006]|nr:MAG: ribonucleoside-diphosphate reductase large chain [Amphiamblys sp. WSBS2006]
MEGSAGEVMYVIKRDGTRQKIDQAEIKAKMERLSQGLNRDFVDLDDIVDKVMNGIHRGVTTEQLDELAAEIAASRIAVHPDYSVLAAKITIDNLHKKTSASILDVAEELYSFKAGERARKPLIAQKIYDTIKRHHKALDKAFDFSRDYGYSYLGIKTLEKSYLLRSGTKIVERPQHMLMRVAVEIHGEDIEKALETYEHMSRRNFIHATPTLMNAGKDNNQLSSCFVLTMADDSMKGIYKTLTQCALISQTGAGIGLNIHNIRASGSLIRGTNGVSNGIVPMLRVFDATARYADQGGSKRPGAFAIYLEPWHADVLDFLSLKKNTGKEEFRARDLSYALWMPDLFMRRVENNGSWTLFCPNDAPGLSETWGEDFEALYERYERDGLGKKTMPAQKLWQEIVTAQIETGNPYIMYKDACNRKTNHQHLGTIKGSNLCTEIVEYMSPEEISVCNLGSLGLPSFIEDGKLDYALLHKVTKIATRNLDKIIDNNRYPLEKAKTSNLRHRPLGLGVQGLADVFCELKVPFDSEEGRAINRRIFETVYHAALEASCELSLEKGVYPSYAGSPVSRGFLQCDMWGVTPPATEENNWDSLREKIKEHGLRNSLLVAPMPTASTSNILGFSETVEPYTSNLYVRRVLAGEFQMVNGAMIRELCRRGLWNAETKTQMIADNGSIQRIAAIPAELKRLYRTVWEIPQKNIIQMAADRGPYIDQSQSLNIYIAEPTYSRLTSMHFYGWKKGLKTGMYYLRTMPASEAVKFTVDTRRLEQIRNGSLLSGESMAKKVKEESEEDSQQCEMSEGCLFCSG